MSIANDMSVNADHTNAEPSKKTEHVVQGEQNGLNDETKGPALVDNSAESVVQVNNEEILNGRDQNNQHEQKELNDKHMENKLIVENHMPA